MSASPQGWLPPRCDSRTGASHRRRGTPCQDASGLWTFRDESGQTMQVLVVSDGHGGTRYDRSELGSRIACHVALTAVQQELSRARLGPAGDGDSWLAWLRETLPQRIVERWSREVLAHAEAHPRVDGAPPSTVAYGATLGVLLLTPRWWGYSGLGDWDLVRISAESRGELISEEPDEAGSGEATFSLCMESAERYFAPRSGLMPLASGQPPFSLLLSSDGIRKSCGTDADFLTLAQYLCELSSSSADLETSELSQALDHISSQGSGDDVSVAIARWGHLDQRQRRSGRQPASAPRIVQPGPALPAEAAAQEQPPAASTAKRPAPGNPWPLWLLLSGGGLGVMLLILGAVNLLGGGPLSQRHSDAETAAQERMQILQSKASDLCTPEREITSPDGATTIPSSPDRELLNRIDGTLNQRKKLFPELLANPAAVAAPLTNPTTDPLSALIAWSSQQPDLNPSQPAPDAPSQPLHQGWPPGRPTAPSGNPLPSLRLCQELSSALRVQWQRAAADTPSSQR